MSRDIVYTIKELELEKCVFNKPVLIQDKDKRSYYKGDIIFNGNKSFIIQTPKLKLRSFTDYSVDLLLNRNKDREKDFYKVLTCLEDIMANYIAKDAQDWFNKKLSKDQVDMYLMKSCIRCPLNMEDSFVAKIEKTNNVSNLSPNDYIVCLIKVDGFIVSGTSAKLDLKIVQSKIIPRENIEKFSHVSGADSVSDHSIKFSEAHSVAAESMSSKRPVQQSQIPETIKEEEDLLKPQEVKEFVLNETEAKLEAKEVEVKEVEAKEVEAKEVEKTPEELESIKFEYLKASVHNNIEFMEKNKGYWEHNRVI